MVGRRVSNKDTIAMFMILKILISLVFFACWVQGKETIDFDAQLKLINKPALKSFRTEYGDIIDCIDIYKQLAFDHPLLKNHKIQMKPETTTKQIGNDGVSKVNKSSNYMPKNIVCPPGSVPIKRATREDLVMAESMKSLGRRIHPANNLSWPGSNADSRCYGFANLVYKHKTYGSKAILNVWSPVVRDQQFSLGGMGLTTGPIDKINTIEAGWLVHSVVSPGTSRFFTYWTSNGHPGCFNTLCPGFVQVSPDITPGLVLKPSEYNGRQTQMYFGLYQDRATGNWWLMADDKYVGYWPIGLLPEMAGGAEIVWWGGEVYSPLNVSGPAMGSGSFPEEGYSKSDYIDEIKVNNDGTQYDYPNGQDLKLSVNKPYCYNASNIVGQTKPYTRHMYFGGPGINCTLYD